jgi:hypothetical protein
MSRGSQVRVEASTLSRSQAHAAETQQMKELVNGMTSMVDMVFPLTDEMLLFFLDSIPGLCGFRIGFWQNLEASVDVHILL